MNKKVLSAILFSALFAGTGTFTSCIDTDEPAGIEELRGAKAELLRAKVAVEQAEAAFRNAKAKVEEANATKIQAEAKISEAQAKLEAARAEEQEIVNEQKRAELEQTIAQIKQEMEEAALQHETAMIQKQEALAEAKRSYDIALKQIAIAEAIMSESVKATLAGLTAEVDALLVDVENKEGEIKSKQDALYDAVLALGADKDYQMALVKKNLTDAEAALAANAAEIEKYTKYLENDAEAADWRTEVAEIEKEVAEYEKKIAVFNLEKVRKQESDEYKALEKTAADAKAAVEKEDDKLAKLATADKLTYKYLYLYDGKKPLLGESKTIKAETSLVEAGEWIAGANFAEDTKGGEIANLNALIASYTTEKKEMLKLLAEADTKALADIKKASDDAVKGWSDALAAYTAAKTNAKAISYASIYAYDTKTGKESGAFVTYQEAMNEASKISDATARTKAVLKAEQAFADALVAFYNTLPADQAALGKISLTVTVGGKKVLQTKTAKEWLSDASSKDVYLNEIRNYFGGDWTAYWTFDKNDKKEELNADGDAIKTKATSALTSWVEKDGLVASKLAALKTASTKAFGDCKLYVEAGENAAACVNKQGGYMNTQPTAEDAMYVGYLNAGAYGTYLLSLDPNLMYEAKNYEAIITDYKAAIDYWTAELKKINTSIADQKAALKAAQDALKAADKAFADFQKEIEDEYFEATAELAATKKSLENVKKALVNAVDKYLAEDYTGEKNFTEWLEEQLAAVEAKVIDLEHEIKLAEAEVKKVEDGKYDAAKKVAELEEQLAKLEAELAELVADLEAAIADVATAESIWAGAAE